MIDTGDTDRVWKGRKNNNNNNNNKGLVCPSFASQPERVLVVQTQNAEQNGRHETAEGEAVFD